MGSDFIRPNQTHKDIIKIIARGDNSYGNVTHLLRKLNYVKVFIGNFQSFAVDIDNTMYSWGLNDYYQLGNQKNENYLFDKRDYDDNKEVNYNFRDTFSVIYTEKKGYANFISLNNNDLSTPFNPKNITKISCGDGYTIFLTDTGSLYSVGRNDKGQLGFEVPNTEASLVSGVKCKSSISPLSYFQINKIHITDIICGSDFSYAKDTNFTFYSWGNNKNSQLGRDNKIIYQFEPMQAEYINNLQKQTSKIVSLCCGWMHACCLTEKGEVYYWGNPLIDYDKNFSDIKTPQKISQEHKIKQISSGFHHIAMLTEKNELLTLGLNDFGQLGYETEPIYTIEAKKVNFPEKSNEENKVIKVVCGAFHTICQLQKNIFGFGQNDNKQIGDYDAEFITWPVKWNYSLEDEEDNQNANAYEELSKEDKNDNKILYDIQCGNGYTVLIYKDKDSISNEDLAIQIKNDINI